VNFARVKWSISNLYAGVLYSGMKVQEITQYR